MSGHVYTSNIVEWLLTIGEIILYGVLKTSINTGLDSELAYVFATPLTIKSNQPSYVQDMVNLKRRASSQNIQRWEIESYIAQTNNTADFLVHSVDNGFNKVFPIRMPQPANLTLSSTPHATLSDHATGVDTIPVSGAAMYTGEFITFANHTKVYLIISGGNTIKISPSLRTAVPSGTDIVAGGKVIMQAMYADDAMIGVVYQQGILTDPGSVKFVEAL